MSSAQSLPQLFALDSLLEPEELEAVDSGIRSLVSALTYEGTSEVHQLAFGEALTGEAAFR